MPKKEPSTPPNLANDLENAANLLLSVLEPRVRDFAFEVADVVLKIPRWQLLLGSLVAQHESGSLPSPSIDPAWVDIADRLPSLSSTCPTCNKTFTPKRYGQRYCSNLCGTLATHHSERRKNVLTSLT
ncbi:MAG: hypothetical protein QXQ53_04815 [Candidatus Methanosuratincola sp.]